MKKLLSISLLICIILTNMLKAQTGKPQYLIETRRADTTYGYIKIELFPLVAPLHSAYFDSLVNISFYDSTAFHRVVPDFVIQGGDPNSRHGDPDTWGEGDPSQQNIPAEFSRVFQRRGTIGAARDTDINSANSQFYINIVDNTFLTPDYTCYGQVVEGMDVADSIVAVPRDENDNPLEKIEMFVTGLDINNDIPTVPVITGPDNGTDAVLNSLKLGWEEAEGAILYDIQISDDPNFNNITHSDSTGSNYINMSGFESGLVTYYWRVRANNGGYKSEFSESRTFITSIDSPELEYPLNNSDSTSLETGFVWHPVEGAVNYSFQIATRPTFSGSSMIYNADGLIDTTSLASGLEEGKKYYWRVRANAELYDGPKSEVWNFTTAVTTGISGTEEIPTEFSLKQNYPNPFNPATTIKYTIPTETVISRSSSTRNLKDSLPAAQAHSTGESGVRNDNTTVKIEVYDVLGHTVATLVNEQQAPGVYEVAFDASGLSSGIYFYTLRYGDKSLTQKMLLLK